MDILLKLFDKMLDPIHLKGSFECQFRPYGKTTLIWHFTGVSVLCECMGYWLVIRHLGVGRRKN